MPRHRALGRGQARRAFLALAAGLAVVAGVLIGGYLLGSFAPAKTTATADVSGGVSCPAGSGTACGNGSSPSPVNSPTPATARDSVTPSPTHAPPPSPRPARPSPASTPSAASSSTGAPAEDSTAASVLAVINQARAQAGLPAYTVLAGLQTSSGKHNQLMADGCGLSHQCPGEPALGDRETAADVHWTAAGENIGEGGPVAGTTAAITQMAVTLTQDMLNEKPPDDGHRQNLLSSAFTSVGIAIYRGSDGTVWMTQDFAN